MDQPIIVTREDLMQPAGVGYGRNLTVTFIRKNDREMGGRGKPRRYDLALVDDFLRRYFRDGLKQQQDAGKKVADLKRYLEQKVEHTRTLGLGDVVGEILGHGGRAVLRQAQDERKSGAVA